MLIIGTDPALSLRDRQTAHDRAFLALRSSARVIIDEALDQVASDGVDVAAIGFTGEDKVALGLAVRSLGAGRIEVDRDLYEGLDDKDGLVVLSEGVDDEPVTDPGTAAAYASSDSYVADEADALAEQGGQAEAPPVEPTPAPPAKKAAATKKAAPRKAAAKTAAPKTAKKAPAKKAAAKKSTSR